MTLQEAFSALYYNAVPPTLIQGRAEELGHILFGNLAKQYFAVSPNGHFSYTNPEGFKPSLQEAPQTEKQALAVWEKWSDTKNRQIERHFKNADYKIPPLFANYLQLRSIDSISSSNSRKTAFSVSINT